MISLTFAALLAAQPGPPNRPPGPQSPAPPATLQPPPDSPAAPGGQAPGTSQPPALPPNALPPAAPPRANASASAGGSETGDVETLLRVRLGPASAVDALRACATALVLAEPERARALVTRARLAPVLPDVRLGVLQRRRRTERLDLPASSDASGAPLELDTFDDVRYEFRATWDLSRLVMNPEELRAQGEALRLADVRREVETQVIRLFFERRRLQAEALVAPPAEPSTELRRALRIGEISAELDALAGARCLLHQEAAPTR